MSIVRKPTSEALTLAPLIQNWRYICIFVLIVVGSLFLYLKSLKPIYQSTATIMVIQSTPTQTLDISVLSVSQQLAETFAKVAKTKPVTEAVEGKMGVSSINQNDIKVRYIPRTQLIEIGYQSYSNEESAKIANGIVSELKDRVATLQDSIKSTSRAMIETVEPATITNEPVFPKIPQIMVVGLLLAFVLAVLIIYLVDIIDDTIDNEDALYKMFPKIPVIGNIPDTNRAYKKSAFEEAFREVRANFAFLNPDKPPKMVAIVSACPGEGKTHVSLELAQGLAQVDKKVLLIDADLHKKKLTHKLKWEGPIGLTEAIALGKSPEEVSVVVDKTTKLHFLGAGHGPRNPGDLLALQKAKSFFEELAKSNKYEVIIIDTPPISAVADSINLLSFVDGALAVVESGRTTSTRLRQLVDATTASKSSLLGLIMNRCNIKKKTDYYGSYR